ncbi:MAG: sulfate ABC transporter permease subunit CysW [Myxococcaceae bacterium]
MSTPSPTRASPSARRPSPVLRDPIWVRWTLTALALVFLGVILVLPIVCVFREAFRAGVHVWLDAIRSPDALAAIRLTLIVAAVALPLNALFGLAAAWAIAKFRFRGRTLLISLIDLPFSVSPVISGMLFVLLFGAQGLLGPWLAERGLQVIFAFPGILLATLFVTFPFVARELIAFMESQGNEEEEASITLGASGLQTFLRVTLPNVKWGLLYGVILANARAMGEFGAVSVVSGHIRGQTNTLPLHIETLYNEYAFAGAFAASSLLALLGFVTMIARQSVEWRMRAEDTTLQLEVPGVNP